METSDRDRKMKILEKKLNIGHTVKCGLRPNIDAEGIITLLKPINAAINGLWEINNIVDGPCEPYYDIIYNPLVPIIQHIFKDTDIPDFIFKLMYLESILMHDVIDYDDLQRSLETALADIEKE